MSTRTQWMRNKQVHDQRQFATEAPKLADRDEATTWIPEFCSAVQDLENGAEIVVDSLVFKELGWSEDKDFRMIRLRELSKRGILRMGASRKEDGSFSHFFWTLEADARIA